MPDQFNPLFVFEIRQVVRNRLILGSLCVYLVLLITLLGYELSTELQNGSLGFDKSFGAELTGLILRLLNGFSLLVLLIHTATTTIDQGLHDELIFHTPMNAVPMELGKSYSAALLTSLFYAVTLPFLTLAWMMRGVDLLALFLTLFSLFLLTQAINVYIAAAFFYCRGGNHLLAAIAGLVCSLPPLLGIGSFSYLLADFSIIRDGEFWGGWVALFWASMVTLMMFFAVSEMFRLNYRSGSAYRRFGINTFYSWLGIVLGIFVGVIFFFPLAGIISAIMVLRSFIVH